jgi:hypothetical protein
LRIAEHRRPSYPSEVVNIPGLPLASTVLDLGAGTGKLTPGCLGQLRSLIAQGDFAGVGPFGQHFTGLVNPGAHQGTVGEEEFLETVIGIPADELAAFCAQFEK